MDLSDSELATGCSKMINPQVSTPKRRRRSRFEVLAIAVIMIMGLLGFIFSEYTRGKGLWSSYHVIEIYDLTLCSEPTTICEGSALNQPPIFNASDPIHACFRVVNGSERITLKTYWVRGVRAVQWPKSFMLQRGEHLLCDVLEGIQLLPGEYRLEIWRAREIVASTSFIVEATDGNP